MFRVFVDGLRASATGEPLPRHFHKYAARVEALFEAKVDSVRNKGWPEMLQSSVEAHEVGGVGCWACYVRVTPVSYQIFEHADPPHGPHACFACHEPRRQVTTLVLRNTAQTSVHRVVVGVACA